MKSQSDEERKQTKRREQGKRPAGKAKKRKLSRREANNRRRNRKRRKQSGKRKRLLRIFRGWMIGIGIFFMAAAWAVFVMRAAGKQQLAQDSVGSVSGMQMNERKPEDDAETETDENTETAVAETQKETEQEEKEGRVHYKGKTYDFNRDIMTFLVMGIDQRTDMVQEQTEGFDGGSADTIFLVVLNPHTKRMQLLAIDRNTMADVDIYDYYGEYKETVQTQICVQHGFGDGTVKSAQYMEKAVSNLLYGLPLNGYCAINMGAIEKINDAVGGVDVVVLEDMTNVDRRLVKGETVHLEGKTALHYVRSRDLNAFGSAEARLERQRQYISAFIAKAKSGVRENPTLPVTVFQELRPYMTTDLNVEKVTYLAGLVSGFEFGSTDMYKIPGKTVMGDVYEEFYVDETAMYEMILEIFYEEVQE